jgi:hypothetical protein
MKSTPAEPSCSSRCCYYYSPRCARRTRPPPTPPPRRPPATQPERVFSGKPPQPHLLQRRLGHAGARLSPRPRRRGARLDFLALTEHNHGEALGSDGKGIGIDATLYKGSGSNSLFSTARRSNTFHVSLQCFDAQRFSRQNLVRGAGVRRGRRQHEECPRTSGPR